MLRALIKSKQHNKVTKIEKLNNLIGCFKKEKLNSLITNRSSKKIVRIISSDKITNFALALMLYLSSKYPKK
jgi:hypothetical protein